MRSILLILCVLFSLTLSAQDKKVVVSSASMMWDMVKNIAGDKVDNKLIVPIGGDPHIYDPTPGDAQKVAGADLIFVNGLTFEGWINELIENSGTKGKTITVTKGIDAISSSVYKNAFDPHAWMDVSLALTYIKNIKDGLVEVDPDNAEFYNSNYSNYKERLEDLDAYIIKNINKIPEAKRILITSHDAFSYYGRRYGLQVEGVIGISTESEAQTSDMIRIQKTIKASGVPAIFVETTIYYDMLKSNTDVIVKALTQSNTTNSEHKHSEGAQSSSLMAYGILTLVLILALVFLIIAFRHTLWECLWCDRT